MESKTVDVIPLGTANSRQSTVLEKGSLGLPTERKGP